VSSLGRRPAVAEYHDLIIRDLHDEIADLRDEIERLRAEVTAIRAERDCAQIQAAHLAQRLVAETEARLHGGPP
jgi:uncharacterized small protein (DUF1192 family)